MLRSLHVKNLALIQEAELEFGRGLNILTGETGAGKSMLMGSINLALGGKAEKDLIRQGADYALVELEFEAESKAVRDELARLDLPAGEEGSVLISRRLQAGKSVCRVNGETVSVRALKELTELLIDIHGQHEHQSLLRKSKHLEILDAFCQEEAEEPLARVARLCQEARALRKKIEEETLDEKAKAREQQLAEFACKEISEAALRPGEDEELEEGYRLMVNGRRIADSLSESYSYTGQETPEGAGNALSRALRAVSAVAPLDGEIRELEEQLMQIDALLNDYNRDVSEYIGRLEFEPADLDRTENRLNEINRLKGKYGDSIEEILHYEEESRKTLEKLEDYEAYMEGQRGRLGHLEKELEEACRVLSGIRSRAGRELGEILKASLMELNFLSVDFEVRVTPEQTIGSRGYDDVEFLLSTNPGEPLKPLAAVASGGELSRIMLAIKTVLAGKDDVDTLIFDEIDTGISGKTAWKVAEQLGRAASAHQVICITHLPQIAAMARTHFVIEKEASAEEGTITRIRELEDNESLSELGRLLGGEELTEAVLANAGEMKARAEAFKSRL